MTTRYATTQEHLKNWFILNNAVYLPEQIETQKLRKYLKKEIEDRSLTVINIPGFFEQREFNFVLLKNSFFRERYMMIYELLKKTFNEVKSDADIIE